MPELPEVETMRRGILAAVGSWVTAVEKLRCQRLPIEIKPAMPSFRRRVVGRTIVEIGRAGKRVVIWLDSGDAIVIEPRMAGLVLVGDAPTKGHLRWRMGLAGGPIEEIFYWDRRGLGNVRLFSANEFEKAFGPEKLGPDGLEITDDEYHERLGRSQREVKVALLDQRVVAGIGNIYAAEILHLVRIHPQRRCNEITKREWKKIAEATHNVLLSAIRHEGSTLGANGTYRSALNKKGGYQNKHRVYGRAGKPCMRCKNGVIERIVQAQRSTFFCPRCQK
jgi:formamidopyrimidine-DNA glycosylase